MPWENIGSVDTGEIPHEKEWILCCLKIAKIYVVFACGEPPDDTKLEVMWNDHELGEYPVLGVWYEWDEPCEYIRACEEALDVFNANVSWSNLKDHYQHGNEFLCEEEAEG